MFFINLSFPSTTPHCPPPSPPSYRDSSIHTCKQRHYRTYAHAVNTNTHTHTHQSKPMSTVAYCASRANTHFHGHYSPWKQRSAFARTCDVDVVPAQWLLKTISYFRAKSLTKIHFSTPLKKIRNEGGRKEQDGEQSWNQINSGAHLS